MNPLRLLAAVVALIAVATAPTATAPSSASALPSHLEEYLARSVKLTDAERKLLISGAAMTKPIDVKEPNKDVSVFGAIWIKAPMRRYIDALTDIENLERGAGFNVTKKISTPPALKDFEGLHIAKDDLSDLRECRVGDCIVKLDEQGVKRFQSEIDWKAANSRAAADKLMRQLAFERVVGYLEGGNDRLTVYRDHTRPTFVAQEFRGLVHQMPELTGHLPDIRRYLLDFPTQTLANSSSFLYWQEVEFGLRPTLRISHVTIREAPNEVIVTSKMLYASHYFWTALELRTLVPDPSRGEGFWFLTINRTRMDGLSGFTGLFVRRRVRSGVLDGTLTVLRTTKQRLEGPR